jgi:hypothetical protein
LVKKNGSMRDRAKSRMLDGRHLGSTRPCAGLMPFGRRRVKVRVEPRRKPPAVR